MIRKTVRRRPELESLESMLLLSGIAVDGHHAAAALVAPAITSPLSGTASGTFRVSKSEQAGAPVSFMTQGNISPVGHLTAKGTFPLFASTAPQSVIISTRHAKVTATLGAVQFGTPVAYQITGATGKYKFLVGDSGEATLTVEPPVNGTDEGQFPNKGHFTITLGSTPV